MQKKWLRGPDTLTVLSGWCSSAQAQPSRSLTLCVWGFSGSCQPPLAAQEKRKSKVHRRLPDSTQKSHPTLNYLGVIYKIWHALILLHLPLQLFKFMSVQINTSESFAQAGLGWRSSDSFYVVFLNKCCLRHTQDSTQESLQQQAHVFICVSHYWLLLSLHPRLHFQSHQHWKSEDLFGLLNPISGAWQVFSVHLTYQKKRWKLCSSALVKRKAKFKHWQATLE